MPGSKTLSDEQTQEQLLRAKFGSLLEWVKPVVQKTVGPFLPDAFDEYEEQRNTLLEEGKRFLEQLSSADLAILYYQKFEDPGDTRVVWDSLLKQEIGGLSKQQPFWFAGGFGNLEYEADFDYWGKMAKYELDEALLLSVGVEPKHIGEDVLDRLAENVEKKTLYPVLEYLVKRRAQFRRHFPNNGVAWFLISPNELKSWIDHVSLDVHVSFYTELERVVLGTKVKQTAQQVHALSFQERETLLKLVAAMACEQYNFDPTKPRNPATSSIRDDIETVGLSMDNKTILKWLKEAVELVPKEYWKK